MISPRRWRLMNQIYAFVAGYGWLPCHRCGRKFSCHEDIAWVPHPNGKPSMSKAVCPWCADELASTERSGVEW